MTTSTTNEAAAAVTAPDTQEKPAADKSTPSRKKAATSAHQGRQGASKTAKATKTTRAKKNAPKAAVPREFSKKSVVLDLLRRKGGATLAEIMTATGWQAHSVRGFISGTVGKRIGLAVESFKNGTDQRAYRIAK
ncbi:MAG TPA: DUF3489 domain-containing protein [Bryobacteraceae bacterium]|nr:DUF3489 domain-containing protein [Bryobacteraceae bacterium]